MNRKEKVMNLFEFLMDFIDESTTQENPTTESKEEESKEQPNQNPDYFGPQITQANFDDEAIKRMQHLIAYSGREDEKRYKEMGVQRIVQQTIKPILEQLKQNAANEHINGFADRTGVTFDERTGKLVEVDAPMMDIMNDIEATAQAGDNSMFFYIDGGEVKSQLLPNEFKEYFIAEFGDGLVKTTEKEVKGVLNELIDHRDENLRSTELTQEEALAYAERENRFESRLPDAVKEAMSGAPTDQGITRPIIKYGNDKVPMPHSGEGTVLTDNMNSEGEIEENK